MPALEKKVKQILKDVKKAKLQEDHVVPGQYVDLGGSPTDPFGELPDYAKGIKPGQAALPKMTQTPGEGTVTGDAKQFTPNQEFHEDAADGDQDKDDKDDDKDDKDVNEDATAQAENQRQYEKIKKGDPQQKLKDPNQKDDDHDGTHNINECTGKAGCMCGSCMKESIKEDVTALFAGETLTPAFKKKAAVIFESAVTVRVNAYQEAVLAELTEQYEKEVDSLKEELTTHIDGYLNYVANKWLQENHLAVETGIRNELVEDFISGLRQLFTESYIDIPAEKLDVLETVVTKNEDLENRLSESIKDNVSLTEEIKSLKKVKLISESVKGLTEVQASKFTQLAESAEFTSEDAFKEKLNILKENQGVKPSTTPTVLVEGDTDFSKVPGTSDGKNMSPDVKNFLDSVQNLNKYR